MGDAVNGGEGGANGRLEIRGLEEALGPANDERASAAGGSMVGPPVEAKVGQIQY